MKAASIEDADVFIACTTFDEANIVSCLTVSRLSRAKTVCFVSKPEYIESLKLVKNTQYEMIDVVIWPEELLTQEIFRIITVPDAVDVENFASGKARLLEYRIKEESILLNKKIKHLKNILDKLRKQRYHLIKINGKAKIITAGVTVK